MEEIQVPWIIFARQAAVYDAPSLEGRLVRTEPEGNRLFGQWRRGEDGTLWLELHGEPGHFASLTTMHRVHPDQGGSGNLAYGSEVVNRWWGLPLEYEPTDLADLSESLVIRDGKRYQLRREAACALQDMLRAAEADNVVIRCVSAYRGGMRQKELYLAAVERDGITQRYSAPPGHSEHQLGTTVDLVDVRRLELFTQTFGETPEGIWLHRHAGRFGFRQTYRRDNQQETGYIPEPWHWRYMGNPKEEGPAT